MTAIDQYRKLHRGEPCPIEALRACVEVLKAVKMGNPLVIGECEAVIVLAEAALRLKT